MEAGEGFQSVEFAGLVEGFGVQLDRGVRAVHAGAAASRFLGVAWVRRAVGAEEEARIAAGRRLHQGGAVGLAFQDRQAIVVRVEAAGEQRVAVQQQVMRGDCGRQVGRGGGDVLGRVARGDVFQHHAQGREARAQRHQVAFDEHALAVEDVDRGVGHLAVQQQRQVVALHCFQHVADALQVAHPVLRIGGGAGRVVLHRKHRAAGLGPLDLLRRRGLGEVQRHQWLEGGIRWQVGEDAAAVILRLRHRGHRRFQVGHHDGAAEPARGMADHRGQRGAIAQMHVPVVGTADVEAVGGHRRGSVARRAGGVAGRVWRRGMRIVQKICGSELNHWLLSPASALKPPPLVAGERRARKAPLPAGEGLG